MRISETTAGKMDDIPMADASDNEAQGGFTIRNVLNTPMSLDPRFQTDSSDESSASGSSSFASCPCSSEPEPEVLSAKFFNNEFLGRYYPNIDFSVSSLHWLIYFSYIDKFQSTSIYKWSIDFSYSFRLIGFSFVNCSN